MKKCPNCGTEWQDKATFCGECGRPFTDELSSRNLIICKKCKRELPNTASFCMHCGKVIEANLVLKKKKVSSPTFLSYEEKLVNCPSCNKKISRFATSCPSCGHPFPENISNLESKMSNISSNKFKGINFLEITIEILLATIEFFRKVL